MSFSEKIFLEAVSCEGTILPACERCPIFGGGGSELFPKPIGEKTFVKPLDRRETACYNIKAVLSGGKNIAEWSSWQLVGLITRRSLVQVQPPQPDLVVDFTVGHFFLRFYGGLRAFLPLKTGLVFHYCHPLIQPKKKQKAKSDSEFFRIWLRFFAFFPAFFQKKSAPGMQKFPA